MSIATRICKVCGKEYEYCHTKLKVDEIYRWQDVACCAEHGSEYFAAVLESRSKSNKPTTKKIKAASKATDNKDKEEE